ncbi:GDSL-type esterase/lipase family protein [Aquabacterium sp.]|uniref:GDSL-type esterase/lipase family protein n=1 Tax=Aquabacterium sp. TaxID=1872578 RepID=UPI002B7A40E8|nr:GDSL-type esterase/lipase family protein [Aquabacterium sp.]HSW08168.1 GDSL-type esterase/lipase family protein [Aquabacterium sp.]
MISRLFARVRRLQRLTLLASIALMGACAGPAVDGAARQPQATRELPVYVGRPAATWRITVADFESQQELSGLAAIVPKPATPRVPASRVSASVSGKDGARDALTLHWQDAWYASLRLEGGPTMDLRPFLADGTLEFDLDVIDMAQGGVGFKLICGPGCERKVNHLLPARAMAGKGWQHLSFAMRCFVRDGDDFSRVTQPFVLEGSGSGEVAVANVRYVRHGKANASCPDYKTESVTPGILAQSWAMSWWLPRHAQKLQHVRQQREAGRNIDLVFIGDSITEGWEREGQPVWDRHYKQHNALALGFGGDHTENVLWRLQHGEIDGMSPKVAVLMIGTNNTGDRQEDPATTAAGIRRNIDEIRQRLPATKILLLAIFPRDEKPNGALRQINDHINDRIKSFADDKQVFFLNINAAFTNPDGTLSKDVMPDLLHLSEKGYDIWARSMAPTLAKLLAP